MIKITQNKKENEVAIGDLKPDEVTGKFLLVKSADSDIGVGTFNKQEVSMVYKNAKPLTIDYLYYIDNQLMFSPHIYLCDSLDEVITLYHRLK